MLSNGQRPTEFTSTIVDYPESDGLRTLCRDGIPGEDDPVLQKKYRVFARGAGVGKSEISWVEGNEIKTVKDLDEDADSFHLNPTLHAKASHVGFRVVLLTTPVGAQRSDR